MRGMLEITRRGARPNYSLVLPAVAAVVGAAFQESATAGVAELADGTKPYAGFVTRAVAVGGPTLEHSLLPQGKLEGPFTAGEDGSFEDAEEVEAEGADYLVLESTGALAANTALKTPLSFLGGKFCAAQADQYAEFMLIGKPDPEVAGNLRIRAKRMSGIKMA